MQPGPDVHRRGRISISRTFRLEQMTTAISSFPDDENGDVLQPMQEQGDELRRARAIDFTVVFPTEHAAKAFANLMSGKGMAVSVEITKSVPEFPWDVWVVNPNGSESRRHQPIRGLARRNDPVAARDASRRYGSKSKLVR